jgi:hypothetical protein
MSPISLKDNNIYIGDRFSVSFKRTLRIPDNDQVFPLPPSLGEFEVHAVADYQKYIPKSWKQENSFFITMYNREALWLKFNGAFWKPNAIKVGVGNINAVSGEPWDLQLRDQPQDYMVCPDQPWLDGINVDKGVIRQFVATLLGEGYTVEGQLTGSEEFGGIQIAVFDPKLGLFPDEPPPRSSSKIDVLSAPPIAREMGLSVGGKMKQKIYPDPYGIDVWDKDSCVSIFVYIISCDLYQLITQRYPPSTPIDAKTYTDHGFPWFALYDEAKGDVLAPQALQTIKSLKEQIKTKKINLSVQKSLTMPLNENKLSESSKKEKKVQLAPTLNLVNYLEGKMTENPNNFSKIKTWQDFQKLGGTQFIYSPSATVLEDKIFVVGIAHNSQLYINKYDGKKWLDEWQSLGAYHFVYTPAIVAQNTNNIDVFAIRVDDKKIYQFHWDGDQWRDPKPLNATAIRGVAALSRDNDALEIFTVGLDNCVYSNYWDGSQWNGWQSIKVNDKKLFSISAPAVISDNQGRTYLFTVNSNNGIDSIYRNKDSQQWTQQTENIAYASIQGVSAISQGDEIDVFASGIIENGKTSVNLSSKHWNGTIWNQSYQLNVTSYYSPTVVLAQKRNLNIFYVGSNNFIYHKTGIIEE